MEDDLVGAVLGRVRLRRLLTEQDNVFVHKDVIDLTFSTVYYEMNVVSGYVLEPRSFEYLTQH